MYCGNASGIFIKNWLQTKISAKRKLNLKMYGNRKNRGSTLVVEQIRFVASFTRIWLLPTTMKHIYIYIYIYDEKFI